MAEMTAFGGRLFPGTTPQGPFYVGRNWWVPPTTMLPWNTMRP